MKKEKVCRQCGEILEKNSKTCLKCGADQRSFFEKHQMLVVFIVILVLICIAIGIIFGKLNHITENSGSASYTQSEFNSKWEDFLWGFEDTSVTAQELVEEYEEDEKTADEKYIDLCMEVTGEIESIEKIDNRTLNVNIKTEGDYNLSFYFEKDENEKFEELADYPSGKEITAVGSLEKNGKNLKLNYCILGDWEVYYDFDNTFDIDLDVEDLLDEAKEKDKNIQLSDKNIMSFDSDILDYGYSYEEIIEKISEISQGEVEISNIYEKDTFINKIKLDLDINGEKLSIELSNDITCFDENLVYAINQELKKTNSEKMFYYSYRDYDEEFGIANIAYSTEEDINKINKLIKNSNLEMDEFEKEATKINKDI